MNPSLGLPERSFASTDARWHSPMIEGAWEGRLVHLSGLDVMGPTAGSLARLVQDREAELWEANRIVSELTSGGVC